MTCMLNSVSIIGDGGMGTVLGMLLCEKNIAARIWGYDRDQLAEIAQHRENKKFLPGYKLPDELAFEPDDSRIMAGADLIVSAVPCQYMRRIWDRLKDYVPSDVPMVSVAKGIENDTLLRPTQIIAEILDLSHDDRLAVLSGPTIGDGVRGGPREGIGQAHPTHVQHALVPRLHEYRYCRRRAGRGDEEYHRHRRGDPATTPRRPF